ncbi:amino acid permease [Streptomyces sp. VRA16 Mangrove soil]|uniref:amino acid permease n=1 Tax=Streptomyces sp. VRA16 Mangrove soil TaxID=2817434 RepID=UPI001A9F0B5F|nr:amino acid permease [Streptomyces sp. VRA16 Mangrove soil]MBO1335591.1 amino acid permease [Streptomyces sp. VRA16 Mangrove soil]
MPVTTQPDTSEKRTRNGLLRTKSIEQSIKDTEEPEHKLNKTLSALDLTVFGVGVVIGAGIFVTTGQVAKEYAGPAVSLAFVVAGVVCALAALCYAEFASTVPVAGSAYTFSYASLGEFVAWIIGWDLVLELALGAATVAVGWSGYAQSLLDQWGIPLPTVLTGPSDGKFGFNIAAALLILVMTGVLVVGVKLSAHVTSIVVAIKVMVVLIIIAVGSFHIVGANYKPFIPPQKELTGQSGLSATLLEAIFGYTPSAFGVMGIFTAAAIVFFSYIGFDVVATAAEETRNPSKDVPRGIIGSLAICTVLYVAVSIVVTGMQKYSELSTAAPLADAFKAIGQPFWAGLINFGAIIGLITVVMILLLGQGRVFFAMSRDGLLPPVFSHVHPKFRTPYRSTIILGVASALLAGFVSLEELSKLVNIGTLFAFVVVALGVIILRRSRPDLPRAFRAPWVPALPIASVAASVWLMLNLSVETWLRFLAWMVFGLVIYFAYGRTHSKLARNSR